MPATVIGIERGSASADVARRGTERRTEDTRSLVFIVQVGSKAEGVDIVLAALGLPRLGDPYDYMGSRVSNIRCRRLEPKQREPNPTIWDVTATYEIDTEEEADIELDFEIIRVPILGSHTEAATSYSPGGSQGVVHPVMGVEVHRIDLKNSAGVPFDPPPEGDESCMVLRISRNEYVTEMESLARLNNSVNRNQFLDFPPRTWRMSVSAKPLQNHFENKWRVSYTLHYRRTTWDLRVLDQGKSHLEVGELKDNLSKDGTIVDKNLDGNGGLAAAGVRVFRVYQWLRTEDWPDLKATIDRYYSNQGGAIRREALPPRQQAALFQNLRRVGFLA